MSSLAPWLWLVDFDANGKALNASETRTDELTTALMAHFAEVHVLRADSANPDGLRAASARETLAPANEARGSVCAAPWSPATFDCIALHDSLVRRRLPMADVVAELEGAHRLLKPGGWLALASPNPPMLRRGFAAGFPRTLLSRLLMKAHFQEIRCLFVDPSADDPCTVVPDVKAAIRAHETLAGIRGKARWKRSAALELGFRYALFPAYLLLARA